MFTRRTIYIVIADWLMHCLLSFSVAKITLVVITSPVVKIIFVVAEITFIVPLLTSSVPKIIFVVAEITFKVAVMTSVVANSTFVAVK